MPTPTNRTRVLIPTGKRRRTAFITDAATREIERHQLLEALEQAAGSWTDKDHPELKHGAEAWVRKQRHPLPKP